MELHRIRGTGLPNVYLLNGYTIEEVDGVRMTTYADLDGLYEALAYAVAAKTTDLSSAEVRFLRTRLEVTQAELGRFLGKSDQAVAKWEKGQASIPSADSHLIRLLVLKKYGSNEVASALNRITMHARAVPTDYIMRHDGAEWRACPAADFFVSHYTAASNGERFDMLSEVYTMSIGTGAAANAANVHVSDK